MVDGALRHTDSDMSSTKRRAENQAALSLGSSSDTRLAVAGSGELDGKDTYANRSLHSTRTPATEPSNRLNKHEKK